MSKNIFIIVGLMAAFAIGYFLKGRSGPNFNAYPNCRDKCETVHIDALESINNNYDQCSEASFADLRNAVANCPCGSPLKPPCLSCINATIQRHAEVIAACKAGRDSLLLLENEKYRNCKSICINSTSIMEK